MNANNRLYFGAHYATLALFIAALSGCFDPQWRRSSSPTLAARDIVEVELGAFDLRATEASSGGGVELSFHLFALVKQEDYDRFAEQLAARRQRLREAIVTTARATLPEEYQEPRLSLFRRRLLMRTNEIFDAPLVQDVVFGEFRCRAG